MKYCHYFFEKSKRPKFYDGVVALMALAYQMGIEEEDLTAFITTLKSMLEESKPSGHAARIHTLRDGESCNIYLQSGKLDDDIARLFFSEVRGKMTIKLKKSKPQSTEKGDEEE